MTTFLLLYNLFFLALSGYGLGQALAEKDDVWLTIALILVWLYFHELFKLRKKSIEEDEAKKAAVESE